jgi:uncharacterized membrane protein YdjX (TVP38/TMEM64 family)
MSPHSPPRVVAPPGAAGYIDCTMPEPRTRRLLALIGFPLLLAALFVPVVIFRREIWTFFSSPQHLREWVSARGALAPLVFMAIQVVQVVVFVIPGEVPQIAGGYLFGIWLGALYSITGILIGSAASFFLSRLLGVPFVHALFPKEQVERVERFLDSRRSKSVFFLLFLIPGIPKDVLCYVAGLSPMRFVFFIGASFAGRLPGILGSVIIGDAAAEKQWILAGIILGAAALLFGAGYLLRGRIEKWIEKISRRGKPAQSSPEDPPTST